MLQTKFLAPLPGCPERYENAMSLPFFVVRIVRASPLEVVEVHLGAAASNHECGETEA